MKSLTNLLRVTVLFACAMWLLTRTPSVHAMNCDKFITSTEFICSSCCSSSPSEPMWTDGSSEGAGIQVLDQMYANCGSPTSSCPSGTQYTGCTAGNNPWYQAVTDSDCCSPSGIACNAGACCSGLRCLANNTCGTCHSNSQACSGNADCCSSICTNGTCTAPPPPCDGVCPSNECLGAANYGSFPATGCPADGSNRGGWCCNTHTPIIIDVDGSGFDFTSLAGGVYFDIADIGTKQLISWTAAQSTNSWLALDRNGNGTIDSGAELFGDATAQPDPPSGESKNGFLALAVFDRPENGGNGDGLLDDQDAVYNKLLLWRDLNHDGISQPDELKHLRDFGISAIALSYRESRKEDQFGNLFRYQSRIYRKGKVADGRWIYDVILLVAPEGDGSSQTARR